PVALLGVIFYGLLIALTIKKSLVSLLIISSIGFFASMWFVYVQAFVLESFCLYCIISAGISTMIFILSLILMIKYKKHETIS
ncbi:MAG TPA: vitamin K epoxide reductase family protein, partial [Candidatus Paceibacterota bacterium]|nr:vitamin K epoxide reductase family protein [Candidatus Paceibacterota bacterium]